MTRQKLDELDSETVHRPPCSSDLLPTDYHFFKHLGDLLEEMPRKTQEDAKIAFADFIASSSTDF